MKRGGLEHRCSHREMPWECEGRHGVLYLHSKKHRECWQSPGNWLGVGHGSSLTGSGEQPWISGFQPPELGEEFFRFESPIWDSADRADMRPGMNPTFQGWWLDHSCGRAHWHHY